MPNAGCLDGRSRGVETGVANANGSAGRDRIDREKER